MSADNKKCFANRFLLQEKLGKGTTGEVYKAFDQQHQKILALKIIRSYKNEDQIQRFIREIKIMQKLNHPNIIKIFDYGKHKNPYFTMEFIEGKTFEAWLNTTKINLRDSVDLLVSIANGMSYAHRENVIHRDLKPENIILKLDKTPIIMDFGAALAEEKNSTRLTQPGVFLGTPAYMSPEQATGKVDGVTALSDVYSLGVILYEATTGQLPFTGSIPSLMLKIVREQPTPPSEINSEIPKILEEIILKAIAKIPSERYNSAAEMALELKKFANIKNTTVKAISKSTKISVTLSSKTKKIRKKMLLKNKRKKRKSNLITLISSVSIVVLFFFFINQSFHQSQPKSVVKKQTEKVEKKDVKVIPKKTYVVSFGKNLILNGSFELPKEKPLRGSITYKREFPFWKGKGPIEILFGETGYSSPYDGERCIELDSDGRGIYQISQILQLNKGQKYLVKFAFRARPGSSLNSNGVKVLVNNKVFLELTKPSSYDWTVHQFEFICRTQEIILSFIDAGTVDSLGSHLDSIELLPIIEK